MKLSVFGFIASLLLTVSAYANTTEIVLDKKKIGTVKMPFGTEVVLIRTENTPSVVKVKLIRSVNITHAKCVLYSYEPKWFSGTCGKHGYKSTNCTEGYWREVRECSHYDEPKQITVAADAEFKLYFKTLPMDDVVGDKQIIRFKYTDDNKLTFESYGIDESFKNTKIMSYYTSKFKGGYNFKEKLQFYNEGTDPKVIIK